MYINSPQKHITLNVHTKTLEFTKCLNNRFNKRTYWSFNVLSTKVPIGVDIVTSPSGDGTAIYVVI